MLTPFNSLDFDGRESNYFYDNRLVYYKKKKEKDFSPRFFPCLLHQVVFNFSFCILKILFEGEYVLIF